MKIILGDVVQAEGEGEEAAGKASIFIDADYLYLALMRHNHTNLSRGGMKGGAKVIIEAHRHEGVFIARSKEDALVTLNSTPGASG